MPKREKTKSNKKEHQHQTYGSSMANINPYGAAMEGKEPSDDLLVSHSTLQRELNEAGLLDDHLLDNLIEDSPLLSQMDDIKLDGLADKQ